MAARTLLRLFESSLGKPFLYEVGLLDQGSIIWKISDHRIMTLDFGIWDDWLVLGNIHGWFQDGDEVIQTPGFQVDILELILEQMVLGSEVIPGHCNVKGNEVAAELARQGSIMDLEG